MNPQSLTTLTTEPMFALVLGRFLSGDVDIATRQPDGDYEFADGGLYQRNGDKLGDWDAEFLSHAQLEERLLKLPSRET